jgi:HSP20 family molecular chaperone IbpA
MAEHDWPVKLYVAGDRVTVAAPAGGFSPEDIEVEVRPDGRLVLDGVLCDLPECGELKSASKKVLLDEWDVGPRHREIQLPAPVDAGAGTVTLGNGVLVVSLPVATKLRPGSLRLEPLGAGRGLGGVAHPTRPA